MGYNVWKQCANTAQCARTPRSCLCRAAPPSAAHRLGLYFIERVETIVLYELEGLSDGPKSYVLPAGCLHMVGLIGRYRA